MSGTLAILDYGSGNLRSAAKAFERAAAEAGTGHTIAVTDDPERVARAERIVLPGVGAFADCLAGLQAVPGLAAALEAAVHGAGRPFLGICVGMQLMAERGLEHGEHRGLGWIAGEVARIAPSDPALKIPHMGWNRLAAHRDHALIADLDRLTHIADLAEDRGGAAPVPPYAYFVHSYALRPGNPDDVVLSADYGGEIVAMVARDNLAGVQFHPEKSQAVGLRLIANFLSWRP